MSIRNIQGSAISPRRLANARPRSSETSPAAPWVRNKAWPALTAPSSTEQKLVGLYAVWPGDGTGTGGNWFAVNCAGAYTVDFGDGTTTNTASGTQTNKSYDFNDVDLYDATVTLTDSGDLVTRTSHGYADGDIVSFYRIVSTTGISEGQIYFVVNATTDTFQIAATSGGVAIALTTNGSASLLPYKVATVTITPQAGQNLTTVNLAVKHNQSGLQNYATGWLDIALSAPNATTITPGTTSSVFNGNLERFNLVAAGAINSCTNWFHTNRKLREVNITFSATATVTSMSSMFLNCLSLTSVPLFNTAAVTGMGAMFSGCSSLTSVPLFNTAAVTNMNLMFSGCSNLTSVPLFNTAAVTGMTSMFQNCSNLTSVPLFNTAAVTAMTSMFSGCSSLTSVPLFNTAAVTNMTGMFSGCSSLTSVPLFNTAAVTNMGGMFSGCSSLISVPLFNTAAVTTMTNMVQNCSSLTSVPLFNTAAVTTMSGMFNGCSSLISVPLFNTAAVTNMNLMFSGCSNLTSVPLFNTAAVTNMNGMFQNCSNLTSVPLFNTAAVTNMGFMFNSCSSLTSVPALVTTAVNSSSNLSSIFSFCSSLSRIQAKDFRFSFSVANCNLSSTALNEIYTNLPTVTSQIITVTNNYGTTGDDTSIAIAKGWSVTS